MNGWIIIAIVVAVAIIGFIATKLGWVDLTNKNRTGTHGGAIGIGDEVFHPARHEAQIELDRQTILPAPAPLAGDGDKGVYGGQVKIDLRDRRE